MLTSHLDLLQILFYLHNFCLSAVSTLYACWLWRHSCVFGCRLSRTYFFILLTIRFPNKLTITTSLNIRWISVQSRQVNSWL